MKNTRGERNHNPGNLEFNEHIVWQGQCAEQTDLPYLQFIDDDHGIRAMAKDLHNMQAMHDCETVTQIIERWAPSSENDTDEYIAAVAGHMAVGADDPLDLSVPGTLNALVVAVIHQENGEQPYNGTLISNAVQEALT